VVTPYAFTPLVHPSRGRAERWLACDCLPDVFARRVFARRSHTRSAAGSPGRTPPSRARHGRRSAYEAASDEHGHFQLWCDVLPSSLEHRMTGLVKRPTATPAARSEIERRSGCPRVAIFANIEPSAALRTAALQRLATNPRLRLLDHLLTQPRSAIPRWRRALLGRRSSIHSSPYPPTFLVILRFRPKRVSVGSGRWRNRFPVAFCNLISSDSRPQDSASYRGRACIRGGLVSAER
jgi:hypothetical protein